MPRISTKSKYHVALDGVGLLLQGAPDAPAYRVDNGAVYGTRFASGDRDYNDLSQWWYDIQTDWSGGIKETLSFEDDAKFYYSTNIDVRTRPGTFRLERTITQVINNTSNSDEILDVRKYVWGAGHEETLAIDGDNLSQFGNPLTNVADSSLGDVNHAIVFKNNLWTFGSSNAYYTTETTSAPYAFNSVTSIINAVINGSADHFDMGVIVASNLYVFGISDTQKVFIAKTANATGSTFTLVNEFDEGGLNLKVMGAVEFNGGILFMTGAEDIWKVYFLDIDTSIVVLVQEIDGGDQTGIYDRGKRYVRLYKGKVLLTVITSDDDGEGAIYEYDTAGSLTKIFETDRSKKDFTTPEARAWLTGGCTIYNQYAFWGNLVYDGEHFYNFIKTVDDDPIYSLRPIGTDYQYLYLVDTENVAGDEGVIAYTYNKDGGYKTGANHSAFLVMSQNDKLQSIDKLLNTLTLGFEKLTAGQAIAVYYTASPVPDPAISAWTLLGEASHTVDGGDVTFKAFSFPNGTLAKKVWIRLELSSTTSGTPVGTDVTLEYLPMPDYRKEWSINVNCANTILRLDGQPESMNGRQLKSNLERMWWTKSSLEFQDVDYAETALNGAATNVATTLVVDDTSDFPEVGRLHLDDEEIFYTGKTPNSFTGCTRGVRGTRAVAHLDNAVIHNAYRVLIIGISEKTAPILQDKELEYVVGLSLREI